MSLPILLDDALERTADGFALRLSLPWIRSLPVSSLSELRVSIDGTAVEDLRARPDGEWWFLQDRLLVEAGDPLEEGEHEVAVSFRLVIPYLPAGPDAPLTLPFHAERTLVASSADGRAARSASRSAGRGTRSASRDPQSPRDLPTSWTLAASGFNWTPDVVRAELPAAEITAGIVRDGVASVIEIEPGQLWRSFPEPVDSEIDAFRADLGAAGGTVSIAGGSLDDWAPDGRRRNEDERLAFVLPQLHAAHRLGAIGVRLPIGQAGPALLARLLPVLHELGLVLFEEAQGRQTPADPETARALDVIAALDDPHVRVLVDISMLMPELPVTYVSALEAAGVERSLVGRVAAGWRDPATVDVLVSALRSGAVPPSAHALFMDMLVRFGRSEPTALRDILPLVGAFHLKFWDLEDAEHRVSRPIRDLGAVLSGSDFAGTLCSEWGGHEWLDADPAEMTRGHLELAANALAEGAESGRRGHDRASPVAMPSR
ncbi:hypothetical protein BCL57_002173 [Agromyces flavus]|uniref:Xylose isomerase-like TIM barrel n=1 Tax=Agromyces flavus TaxID=589382 RepID=A0A1H1P1L9_9MICO|nr:sugar phosphate isomerase/epimerase [Agromyces flavus]MCP2368014.1 hypothetical protein [Agromyces flavus]GGI47475.1 hypothetical protein GCM10010932_21630 [Agromyces flavus]SDS04509.1 hypothetical protein SAMN04489721_0687 [Agromyces flavus]